MKYFLVKDYKYKHINDAGSKARWDVEQIMSGMGICPIGHSRSVSKNRLLHFARTLGNLLKLSVTIKRGDILILQFPVKYYDKICRLAHRRGTHVITLIHDLSCFRKKSNSVEKEVCRLNLSDGLIGSNSVMCQWLCENGFVGNGTRRIIIPLHLFDFLSDSTSPERQKKWPMHQVVYAGQLSHQKNRFLYEYGNYIKGYAVNVYGRGFDESYATHPEFFHVKGFMLPDRLIGCAEGDFGLVWDGGSVDDCSGDWGEYLMFNSPHKVSLYLRCGLPIIIWRKAALAEFVEENGIGICIDSLREINGIYEHLTPTDYYKMLNNVLRVSRMLAEGGFFKRALSEAVKQIEGKKDTE